MIPASVGGYRLTRRSPRRTRLVKSLVTMNATILVPSIEVGGTHVTAGLVEFGDGPPRVLHDGGNPSTPPAPPSRSSTPSRTARRRSRRRAARPGERAVPGPFDYARGIGLFRGVGKFESLYGVEIEASLRERLPGTGPMRFLNDAEAFLLGEWSAGAARGHGRAAGITLGTGIGSAFLAGGVAVTVGPDVPPEGRADLLTWDGRPLEESVSRRAIIAGYERATGVHTDVREIAALARSDVPAARDVLDHAFRVLGRALGSWWVRFGASVVVVGGAMAGSWDLIEPALLSGAAPAGAVPPLVRPHHPDFAPLIGAALHAHPAGRPGSA